MKPRDTVKIEITPFHNDGRTSVNKRNLPMKTHIKNMPTRFGEMSRAAWACLGVVSKRSRVLPTLIAGLVFTVAGPLTAQTFQTLYSFTASDPITGSNSDGANPQAGLILSGNILYGTANSGGTNGYGMVFAVKTDGTGFTNLHNFTLESGPLFINNDGGSPSAGLILSGNTLFGTAFGGGSSGNGTLFAIKTDGTGFTNLHSFTASDPITGSNSDGANPQAGLFLSGNTLYGTAAYGGTNGSGTVFAFNTNGMGFTNLYNFTGGSDGAFPSGGLILLSNTLYGTAYGGGSGFGTVFALNTDGTGFTNLHSFTLTSGPLETNSDGALPYDGLILSGNTLYGTANGGGTNGSGTVFAVNTNGMGFTNLHAFAARSGSFPDVTNSDGVYPQHGLIISGTTLFGTTAQGSTNGSGTVFALNTNGTGFTTLHTFAASGTNSSGVYTNGDGGGPQGGLFLSGNTLYGTAAGGGSSGNGTVFSLSFPPPQLIITHSGTNAVLTWPASYTVFSYSGYSLESTTNLVSPVVWNAVNGQYVVTNPLSGPQMFFRLTQ
jgi:uncharacterized repeat protein (TIGR03803 family)